MTVTSQFVAQSLSLTGVTIGIGAQTRTCVGSGPHPLTNAGFPAGFALRASSFGDEWTARQAFAHLIGNRRAAQASRVRGCSWLHSRSRACCWRAPRRGCCRRGARAREVAIRRVARTGFRVLRTQEEFHAFRIDGSLPGGRRAGHARGADGVAVKVGCDPFFPKGCDPFFPKRCEPFSFPFSFGNE